MHFYFNFKFKIRLISIAFILIINYNIHSQSESDLLKQANEHYKRHEYFEASKNYKACWTKIEKDKSELLKAGMSAYEANSLDFAIRCLEKVLDLDDPFNEMANWYLARSHKHKNEFEEAILNYKKFYRVAKNNDPRKLSVKNELLRCEEGTKYKRKLPLAIVESISSTINTLQDEFAPIPDPKQNGSYYISAIRNDNKGGRLISEGISDQQSSRLRSDIFYLKQTNGSWTLTRPSDSERNTNMDDQVLSCPDGGNLLIFYRTWNDEKGTLLIDTLNHKEIKLNYSHFNSTMIADIGDHAVSIYQDSLMIFSSCRIGGYGGYDLYVSVRRNGNWSNAINLGPKVNSPFNEDYPFLANDGQTLYFSSDNLKSIGGFDIFKTKYQPEAQQWTIPQNLGIPVNSAGNDMYFRLTNDGLAGIFSSDRKLDNQGGQDIYLAYFKEDLTEQLSKSEGSPLSTMMDLESFNLESNPFEHDESISKNQRKTDLKSYFIEPIYYTEEDFKNGPRNQKTLDRIVDLLQTHPELKIQFIGHSYEDSQDPINLYFSIKKAEELEKYLVDKKIVKSRITCFGLGSSLILAKEKINGIKSVIAERLNKRVEINVIKMDSSQLELNYAIIAVPESMKSGNTEPFRELRSGLTYSLYLGESTNILNHPMIHFSEGLLFVEKNAVEDKYQYYFGLYKNFKEAETALNKFQSKYQTPLKLKAFNSGKEITRREIIDHVLQDEDLLLYLNYLNAKEKNGK